MNRIQAIHATHPNIVTMYGDDAFDESGNRVVYNEAVVQAYIDAHAYIEKRKMEYPPLADQLDMLYHDRINNTDTWMEAIQAVKTKYPKS